MIKISKANKESVLRKICAGKIDAATLSTSSLIDDIILSMSQNGVIECLKNGFADKRADNTTKLFELILTLAIAAKMKIHTSLSDIPFALSNHRTICELGYSMWDTDRDIKTGLMSEGTLRFLVDKYSFRDFINGYNHTIQNYIMPKMDIQPTIHILDCTKLEVNLKNKNYEDAGLINYEGELMSGYKLSTIRGIVDDTGIIEHIEFGAINIHDLELSRKMLLESPVLKPNDILINDRGFLSRELINILKTERNVDSYVPLKKNMHIYNMAISTAKMENNWIDHPNKKHKNQKIALVSGIGGLWESNNVDDDVEINGCVVWDTVDDEYFVFITTDTNKSATQIIKTYELRPEIEEDYRQLKDFWKLEDFKSTKLHVILFHIICVLLGYLFFQLYTLLPEGEEYAGKSLPVALKKYDQKASHHIIIYSGDEFGVLAIFEVVELYAKCNPKIQSAISEILKLI